MRKLIGKIILWFLKDQVLEFKNGYVEMPDLTSKEKTDKPIGRVTIK